MASKRQSQMASLVRQRFSEVLMREGAFIYGTEPLVTVTNVSVTPDFGEAKIYLSVYNVEDKQTVLLEMEESLPRLKQLFGQRIRKQVRRVPSLKLHLDDTLDEMYRLNQIFDNITDKEKSDETKEEKENNGSL
ncbi:MAG: 30S ribosome-binding factor RbfA [Saprospiraceae bacterium]